MRLAATALVVGVAAMGCSRGAPPAGGDAPVLVQIPLRVPPRTPEQVRQDRRSGIGRLTVPGLDESAGNRAALGRRIFFSPDFGAGGSAACTRCHNADHAGAGGLQSLAGAETLAVPPIVNLSAYESFGTDGRSHKLVEYMASHLAQLNAGIEEKDRDAALETAYGPALRGLFPFAEGDTAPALTAMVSRSLAAYLGTLVTASPIDGFLAGNDGAISPQAGRGFDLFFEKGCVSCHDGPVFGGRKMATLGLSMPWPGDVPLGEHAEYKQRRQRRVSSLRTVALTAPYFHESAIDTLPAAVELMALHQLGVTLAADERDAIVAFLQSMVGTPPPSFHAP